MVSGSNHMPLPPSLPAVENRLQACDADLSACAGLAVALANYEKQSALTPNAAVHAPFIYSHYAALPFVQEQLHLAVEQDRLALQFTHRLDSSKSCQTAAAVQQARKGWQHSICPTLRLQTEVHAVDQFELCR